MYDSNTHYIIITHSCLVIPSRGGGGGGGTRDARATQNSLRVSISVRARVFIDFISRRPQKLVPPPHKHSFSSTPPPSSNTQRQPLVTHTHTHTHVR